jgi:formylglycine-generating enzyme required for sulfatase activity
MQIPTNFCIKGRNLKEQNMRTIVSLLSLASITPLFAEPLDVFRDCDVCPEMIELPLGEFVMGAPEDEFRNNYEIYFPDEGEAVEGKNNPAVVKSEGPQHRVIIDLRVAMSKNEVTFEEWMACVDAGGCGGYVPRTKVGATGSPEAIRRALTDSRFVHTPSEAAIAEAMTPAASIEEAAQNPRFLEISGSYPVIRVSYLDAQAYVAWLNQKFETDAYRLPTEAEWEYAARAGTTTRFAQGFEPKPEQANISGEATEDFLQQDRPDLRTLGHPVPVDELDAANPWGLRHMSGNVGEITLSCYNDHYEGWSTASEWLKNGFREGCNRVERGGNYADPISRARLAYRFSGKSEAKRSAYGGFRILKELD